MFFDVFSSLRAPLHSKKKKNSKNFKFTLWGFSKSHFFRFFKSPLCHSAFFLILLGGVIMITNSAHHTSKFHTVKKCEWVVSTLDTTRNMLLLKFYRRRKSKLFARQRAKKNATPLQARSSLPLVVFRNFFKSAWFWRLSVSISRSLLIEYLPNLKIDLQFQYNR